MIDKPFIYFLILVGAGLVLVIDLVRRRPGY